MQYVVKWKGTIDVWVLTTRYYEDGEVAKTSMNAPDDISPDYLVIGLECCGHMVPGYWNQFLHGLGYQ